MRLAFLDMICVELGSRKPYLTVQLKTPKLCSLAVRIVGISVSPFDSTGFIIYLMQS
jgi:hypothetical protein